MTTEMGIWRIDGDSPRRLNRSSLPLESMLEDHLAKDPSLLGTDLMIVGRQVRTPYNTYIDLLAMDAEGSLTVLELKRDKTPREVVAQALDYGSWVSTLTRDQIVSMASEYLQEPFEAAFDRAFSSPVPDEISGDVDLTIVASALDASSERIVTYLRDFGVPINAVFFTFMEDEGRQYLARTWLAPDEPADGGGATPGSRKSKVAPWNGLDWYVNFGDGLSRDWEDGREFGFISAGGGQWYSRTLRNVPVGARVNVYLPQRGYVAVGMTLRPATLFTETDVLIGESWEPLVEKHLRATYRHSDGDVPLEQAEYAIPVRWIEAVPTEEAFREPGMFASQHSACKLRQDFTLQKLASRFGLDQD